MASWDPIDNGQYDRDDMEDVYGERDGDLTLSGPGGAQRPG